MTEPGHVELVFRGQKVVRDRALVMAILNRSRDSFYDQGATFAEQDAQQAIRRIVADGADVIDIGGIRAEAGDEVGVREEIDRVVPTVRWIREIFPEVIVSVDTWRGEVADAVCRAGAHILNDNFAGADPEILDVAAQYGAGYVCTHIGEQEPWSVPRRHQYDDVVASVIEHTTRLAESAVAKGVPREGVLIDPTLGILYGKDTQYNIDLLRGVRSLVDTGWPVLIALSNKDFLGEILDADTHDRVPGTLAATALAAADGAVMFRGHEVRATRQVLEMVGTIKGSRPPARLYEWK
ncbi:MAG TPA: dihydropteroate synthase [Pseudonocardiaceae bacterium]|jgi:dihydropteroate synthase|nr:dihydropteroate synthase [Pseudonocardiaceae bacterium]